MSAYKIFKVTFLISVIFICGCMIPLYILNIKKDNKDITIQYSSNVFLEPSLNKNVFVQVKNLACPQFTNEITNNINTAFTARNFNVIKDPINAQFLLQANIVSCNNTNKEIVQYYIEQGYGSKIDSKQFGRNNDIYVSMIADLQIYQRAKVNTNSLNSIKCWNQYQTRVAVMNKKEDYRNIKESMKHIIEEFSKFVVSIFNK